MSVSHAHKSPQEQIHYATQDCLKVAAPAWWRELVAGHKAGRIDAKAAMYAASIPDVLCSLNDAPHRAHNQVIAETLRLVMEYAPELEQFMREAYRCELITGARALEGIDIEGVVCDLRPPAVSIAPLQQKPGKTCEHGYPAHYEPPFVSPCACAASKSHVPTASRYS
ncbi:MAG: hypothetical protein CVV05_15360 [Gammaproteobacteria bacterium HGW-Gammaproteobacteria-1]|jgi:hypothetical protein|nr:MAG: hypothetical protein CVV05_15360 [Gammaproteobacteria bacterium HGW-Gammaproteobacteria-1]